MVREGWLSLWVVKRSSAKLRIKKLSNVIGYIQAYEYALNAAVAVLSAEAANTKQSGILSVGRTQVWPCSDGVLVAITGNKDRKISVEVNEPVSITMARLFEGSRFSTMYHPSGWPTRFHIRVGGEGGMEKGIFEISGARVVGEPGDIELMRAGFDKVLLIGWQAPLTQPPDEKAVGNIRFALAGVNLSASPDTSGSLQSLGVTELVGKFKSLLEGDNREEELQKFLSQNPAFLYPDMLECFPKFKLGDDFVTDYVFKIQGAHGLEYVFVEIERSQKPIFVDKGHFSADFTQAKSQLLSWEGWIEKNHSYVSQKLPGLFKPRFHLVMGREYQSVTSKL